MCSIVGYIYMLENVRLFSQYIPLEKEKKVESRTDSQNWVVVLLQPPINDLGEFLSRFLPTYKFKIIFFLKKI